ncbi:MAG: phosphoribosylformylglycinamidine synthase subunit PurQ [Kiritimatiellia bacterium]
MASKPPVLIITGYGVNCEAESRHAWETAGAAPRLVHLNDLLENPAQLARFKALMFIGGFSFGDHMGSGEALALRLRSRAEEKLVDFISRGNLMLGVCNGFQVMVKLGLLPGLDGNYMRRSVTLTHNDCGAFQNFWITLRFEPESHCVFTRGLKEMPLPIRHGEGKIVPLDKTVLAKLEREHCVACRYIDPATGAVAARFPHNPNGSVNGIAGLCDPTGKVFGLMPHPEAYLFPENHPQWQLQKIAGRLPKHGLGLKIFENAVEYLS